MVVMMVVCGSSCVVVVVRDVVWVYPTFRIAHAEHGPVRVHFGLDITDKLVLIELRKHFED